MFVKDVDLEAMPTFIFLNDDDDDDETSQSSEALELATSISMVCPATGKYRNF